MSLSNDVDCGTKRGIKRGADSDAHSDADRDADKRTNIETLRGVEYYNAILCEVCALRPKQLGDNLDVQPKKRHCQPCHSRKMTFVELIGRAAIHDLAAKPATILILWQYYHNKCPLTIKQIQNYLNGIRKNPFEYDIVDPKHAWGLQTRWSIKKFLYFLENIIDNPRINSYEYHWAQETIDYYNANKDDIVKIIEQLY